MKRVIFFIFTLGISEFFRSKGSSTPKEFVGYSKVDVGIKKFYAAGQVKKDLTRIFGKNFEMIHPFLCPSNSSDPDTSSRLSSEYGSVSGMVDAFMNGEDGDEYFGVYIKSKITESTINKCPSLYINVEKHTDDLEYVAITRVAWRLVQSLKIDRSFWIPSILESCPSCDNDPKSWHGNLINCSVCGYQRIIEDVGTLQKSLTGQTLSIDQLSAILTFSGSHAEFRKMLKEIGIDPNYTAALVDAEISEKYMDSNF